MNSSLVTDLGLGPEVWLFLSLLACVTLFFKFSRFWSVRNLDLLLLFVLAPGMMLLVGNAEHQAWIAYIWLFLGSGLWLIRCCADLGLARRPLLEPNLNASGLLCLSLGVLGLLLAETVSLPVEDGAARTRPSLGTRRPIGRGTGQSQPGRPAGDPDRQGYRSAPKGSEARTSAGDRLARAGQPGASGAGRRLAGDRLAAFRASAHGHGDGRMLFVAPLHADGPGR